MKIIIASMCFLAVGLGQVYSQDTPRLISYISANDGNVDWGNPNSPYTHYVLSFIVQASPNADPTANLITAGGWTDGTLVFNQNSGIVDTIHAAGKKALIAYGGATMDFSFYSLYVGQEPQLAAKLAEIVRDNDLDGIDIDWEDTVGFTHPNIYDGRQFLIDLTTALRNELPRSEGFEISHAPQPPYLDPSHGVIAGYFDVMNAVGEEIDFLNMQYYNNQPSDPAGILNHYQAVINSGVLTPDQLLVGKPVAPENAGSGFLEVAVIANEIVRPLKDIYGNEFGGAFNWEFKSDTDFEWGNTVAADLFGDPVVLGDVNQDGMVDLLDVAPFVLLLNEGQFQLEADVNQDRAVDLLDVAPFVQLLSGG